MMTIAISCNTSKNLKSVTSQTFINKGNVLIDSSLFGLGACEPSIAINPINTDVVVAGSILNRVYQSSDGGATWNTDLIKSSSGVYGDPVIEADYLGNFHYGHLSNPTGKAWSDDEFLDRIVVQTSKDHGHTWSDGGYPAPNPPKDQDKEWIAIDPSNNDLIMCWTEFDKYGSKEASNKSRIVCSRCTYNTEIWSAPVVISEIEGDCLDSDNTTEGAVPAIDNNGTYYVSWAMDEKIYFDKSYDQGKTWLTHDIIIADQPGGWDFMIEGISRCNGFPVTKVDLSQNQYQGTIYVNWADQRNGAQDTDIWLSKSTDQGDTWSPPLRVNNDGAGHQQFFTWMDVDPVTGYIYIIFYDRREHNDLSTDVYLAYSTDGGTSFKNEKISDRPFIPNANMFFGDYNDISVYNGVIRPIWTRMEGMKMSVWTSLLSHRIK
jgi:hypothetical protein